MLACMIHRASHPLPADQGDPAEDEGGVAGAVI